jgi:cobalamin biosynthesis protein CobD/CbiB
MFFSLVWSELCRRLIEDGVVSRRSHHCLQYMPHRLLIICIIYRTLAVLAGVAGRCRTGLSIRKSNSGFSKSKVRIFRLGIFDD